VGQKSLFLLSAYMQYIRESIGFTPKILKIFFCLKHVFTDKKSLNVKIAIKKFRLSRAAAAVDNFFLHAYSLDHMS
jgi:hypothetical protein